MIGNISKDIWRQVSSYATVLISYLPVGKFDGFTEKMKQGMRYQTFHYCMGILMKTLAEAGQQGVNMACADGFVQWIWPILATYIADYLEQCLVACCMENCCPICKVQPKDHGSVQQCDKHNQIETLELLAKKAANNVDKEFKEQFTQLGLRPVYPPFWQPLPFNDIFQSFTSDLLYQLHKGVFKDHLVKWCTNLIGVKELDD
jgi:hypothetical protein